MPDRHLGKLFTISRVQGKVSQDYMEFTGRGEIYEQRCIQKTGNSDELGRSELGHLEIGRSKQGRALTDEEGQGQIQGGRWGDASPCGPS